MTPADSHSNSLALIQHFSLFNAKYQSRKSDASPLDCVVNESCPPTHVLRQCFAIKVCE